MRVDDLHGGDPLLQQLGGRTLVALEGEFHVLRSDRLAVVEPHSPAYDELVSEPVRRGALQDSARLGAIGLTGSGLTSASWIMK